jgi:hypothetical protein
LLNAVFRSVNTITRPVDAALNSAEMRFQRDF